MKRILKLKRHLPEFAEDELARAVMSIEGVSADMLKRFGFVEPFDVG